jgi:glucose-6-phosphate isomerase
MTSWPRFKKYYYQNPELGIALDISRIPFPDGFFGNLEKPMQKAFAGMAALEKGAIANNDEKRMVGALLASGSPTRAHASAHPGD